MSAGKPSATGDTVRLQHRKRGFEALNAVEVSAVGTGARRKVGLPIEEQGGAFGLHGARYRLDVRHFPAFLAGR